MSDLNPDNTPDLTPAPELENQIQETAEAQASEAEPGDFNLRLYQEEKMTLEGKLPLEGSKVDYERRQRIQLLKESVDLHALRQKYTDYLFKLTCLWLLSVLLFVGLTGFRGPIPFYFTRAVLNVSECADCPKYFFNLTDKVLIAFITSTTASVIGIFVIVAKWLFPSREKSTQTEEKDK